MQKMHHNAHLWELLSQSTIVDYLIVFPPSAISHQAPLILITQTCSTGGARDRASSAMSDLTVSMFAYHFQHNYNSLFGLVSCSNYLIVVSMCNHPCRPTPVKDTVNDLCSISSGGLYNIWAWVMVQDSIVQYLGLSADTGIDYMTFGLERWHRNRLYNIWTWVLTQESIVQYLGLSASTGVNNTIFGLERWHRNWLYNIWACVLARVSIVQYLGLSAGMRLNCTIFGLECWHGNQLYNIWAWVLARELTVWYLGLSTNMGINELYDILAWVLAQDLQPADISKTNW